MYGAVRVSNGMYCICCCWRFLKIYRYCTLLLWTFTNRPIVFCSMNQRFSFFLTSKSEERSSEHSRNPLHWHLFYSAYSPCHVQRALTSNRICHKNTICTTRFLSAKKCHQSTLWKSKKKMKPVFYLFIYFIFKLSPYLSISRHNVTFPVVVLCPQTPWRIWNQNNKKKNVMWKFAHMPINEPTDWAGTLAASLKELCSWTFDSLRCRCVF